MLELERRKMERSMLGLVHRLVVHMLELVHMLVVLLKCAKNKRN